MVDSSDNKSFDRDEAGDAELTGAEAGRDDAKHSDSQTMTFIDTTQSVLWAMLGVQSKRNASRDFSKGKFVHFVIIGLGFTLVFIFTLVSIIRYVLGDAV